MDKLIEIALKRFEEEGIMFASDIQPILNKLGINRTIQPGDDIASCVMAILLKRLHG